MKKVILLCIVIVCSNKLFSQNLISNPSFEEFVGNCTSFNSSLILINDNFDSIGAGFKNSCVLKDWMTMSESPDVWSSHAYIVSLPANNIYCKHIYPHSDSTIVGGLQFASNSLGSGTNVGNDLREMIENKLAIPLVKNHTYKFRMYVHLFDTIPAYITDDGQIAGINSFGAYFSDTVVNLIYSPPFPMGKFTPQIQINQMVTDTGNWVLLTDSFIAKGGERYVCIGNFKSDSLTGWQLVDSIRDRHVGSYYFFDDVSLVDITPNGVEEVENRKLEVYPNPCGEKLLVTGYQLLGTTIEVTDLLGRIQNVKVEKLSTNDLQLMTEYLPSGIYFIKATDVNGNVSVRKFVKE